MMRKGAKQRDGIYSERGKNRGAAGERGMDIEGRLEEERLRKAWTDRGKTHRRGQKKGRGIVIVGGGGSGCVLPAQPVGTNKWS